jgi:glycosyltransferase involved in cell wall biosynthesis
MKVLFCVYGYSPQVERLQPWLTIHKVASVLISLGWELHLLTDVDTRPSLDGFRAHFVKTMRPSNAAELRAIIDRISPDRVVVLTTPLNLLLSGWYRYVGCRLIALLSYPFYTRGEIVRALPHLSGGDLIRYGRHALIPAHLWSGTLRKYYSDVIAQSPRTANRVAEAVGPNVAAHYLKVGLDLGYWTPARSAELHARRTHRVRRFLYVGSPKSIRGFDVLLKAFSQLDDCQVQLRILARGSSAADVKQLRRRIDSCVGKMCDRVEIIGGWMQEDHYREQLRLADVAVLPFILVPSELPVSIIECIACGTPVIATDVDGLPDAVGEAGIIVRSGSAAALAGAMRKLLEDPERLMQLRERCIDAREGMADWEEVGKEWHRVLSSRK